MSRVDEDKNEFVRNATTQLVFARFTEGCSADSNEVVQHCVARACEIWDKSREASRE